MQPSTRPAQFSFVKETPAATPEAAHAHFSSRLAFETDCADVHTDLSRKARGVVVVVHVSLLLPAGTRDVEVVRRAQERKLDPAALSPHYLGPACQGLLLGFCGSGPAELRRAATTLVSLL